ncbi:MAG TPA: LemA family protein [Candidatus Bathyarchaeia archaeon]|nr:LemA family protein [Candidatus Bathyarchaeia archaeon]
MGMVILAIIAFLAIAIVMYFVTIYNGLIVLSRNIDKAWSNIDVLLKQRHDEIPKLVKVCEGYMQFERQTLEKITLARTACMNAGSVAASAQAEGQLSGLLKNLFAVAENYPDLKANTNFTQLQTRVSYLESQIADRRELFNESTNTYNIRIAQIPDVFVANMLAMKPRDLFQVAESDRQDVTIDFKMP